MIMGSKKIKLEREIRKFSENIKMGDKIDLMYEGESIADYVFIEWSLDSKTPLDWLRGCMVFEVALKNRDESKLSLKFGKVEYVQFGKTRITIK